MSLREYLTTYHPRTAEKTLSLLSERSVKWGANLNSETLKKLVANFYQDVSRQVIEQAEKALALLPEPASATKSAAKEIRRKADYDFSEVAKQFPIGAFVIAELDGKVGEIIDYTLEGPIGNRRPNVKFYVAAENKAYRRSLNQIKIINL